MPAFDQSRHLAPEASGARGAAKSATPVTVSASFRAACGYDAKRHLK
jgi:hypothetical protein